VETRPYALVLDDEQSRNRIDLESLDKVRVLVGVYATQPKRLMVAAALQHLGQEALCPARPPRSDRVEEEKLRSIGGRFRRGGLRDDAG
jgi:hypothetical protein